MAKGRFERAEVLYRQALTLVPRDSQLWLKHGETLRHLGQQADAIDSYRMAATILATDGHFSRAIASMKLALELRPNDVELISDIIRLEMRHSEVKDRPAFVSPHISSETPAPLLALPSAIALPLTPSPEFSPVTPPPFAAPPQNNALPEWPQVRRLSESEVAMRASAQSQWVVVSSVTPVVVRYVAELE